ncbi:hypothetical protein rsdtw13_19110 [Clostridium sp. TW13]|uniref:Uncharacterized protein n=1 Tax=Inconstantimicrobium mannanitabidum TaxID=1604901 RepID=A0ACB5RBP2_9CLOT|nr:hypothetical protein rsdtw13_19110 [Clostridium sp. TW13]
MAKLKLEPVIFKTYRLIARLYMDVPNRDMQLAAENKVKFDNSSFFKKLIFDITSAFIYNHFPLDITIF